MTFADRGSHDGWRGHPDHRTAQRRGREALHVVLGQVEDVTDFSASG